MNPNALIERHTITSPSQRFIYGGPVVYEPSGSRYHSPLNVIRSIACSMLRTSHGLNPGISLANLCLSHSHRPPCPPKKNN